MVTNNTDARLSSLETTVHALEGAVQGIYAKLDDITAKIGQSHRWDWASIWGGVACLLIVIGAVGKSYIAPIYTQIEFGKHEWEEGKRDVREIREIATLNRANIDRHAAVFGAKLTEVETQFDWLNDIVNMRDRSNHLLTSILWEEIYKRPLPQPSMPPAGPGTTDGSRANGLNGVH